MPSTIVLPAEIDHHLQLGRQLEWKVRWVFSSEDSAQGTSPHLFQARKGGTTHRFSLLPTFSGRSETKAEMS
jgi:hypothetical protein